jgi:cytosine/creatinine deaminase
MRGAFESITVNSARAMGLEGYGEAVGCRADLVLLQARDSTEAIRLKATRLAVIRAGKVVARAAPRVSQLVLAGRPGTVDPSAYAPQLARPAPGRQNI